MTAPAFAAGDWVTIPEPKHYLEHRASAARISGETHAPGDPPILWHFLDLLVEGRIAHLWVPERDLERHTPTTDEEYAWALARLNG